MQRLPPDHVYQLALRNVRTTGKASSPDPLTHALERILLGEEDAPREVAYAYRLFVDDYQREVVEAFLLAGANEDDLREIFDIPVEVTRTYRALFFDLGVFLNRLDVESYVRFYPEDRGNGWGKIVKTDALDQGLEYLRVSFGRDRVSVDPQKVVDDAMRQSYLFMKVATKHPLDSPKAKEARQWTGTLVDVMKSRHDMLQGRDTSDQGLVVRLEMVKYDDSEPTITPDQIVSRAPDNRDDEDED